MKTMAARVFLALFLCCLLDHNHLSSAGQSELAGTWQAQSSPPGATLTVVLNVNGSKLTGAVSQCASWSPVPIYDTEISGSTATFKCRSGSRTVRFTATFAGDELLLTWDMQAPPYGWSMRFEKDGDPRGQAMSRLFGPSAPRRLTARRVAAASGELADLAARAPWEPAKAAAVSFARILHSEREPQNWLTYSGNVLGQRYSPLTQITPENVHQLELAWTWQARSYEKFEATPLVVDGVLYTVEPPNTVIALDAATGRALWTYEHTPPPTVFVCCGGVNRGLAILDDTLFVGTLDAKLLALHARTGKLIWSTSVADADDPSCKGTICYSITHARLIIKNMVLVGPAGGDTPPERGIRGFIAAFDARTGKEVWRFSTIPGPGEPGHETWSGNSWKYGGAAVWNTGSYDPDLNLTYWGTGNPSPNYSDGAKYRIGDNLYSASLVALDADTGHLKWHYQFTPHDDMDWDSAQVPVLAATEFQGASRKAVLFANKNGIMYVLDRATGELLKTQAFAKVNWLSGFDDRGRPLRVARQDGRPVWPARGATQWYPASWSPRTELLYIPGAASGEPSEPTDGPILAFDPATGNKQWEFRDRRTMTIAERPAGCFCSAGVLTTATDVLFGGMGRYFYGLDARTGHRLWKISVGRGPVQTAAMSYAIDGKQYVAVPAGNTLFVFALPQ